jgi:hypothetical protein
MFPLETPAFSGISISKGQIKVSLDVDKPIVQRSMPIICFLFCKKLNIKLISRQENSRGQMYPMVILMG